jgi:hypothetical protein
MSDGDMITPKQLTAIPTILGAHGVRTRAHRLAIISHIIGEPIASTKYLMRSEAGTVIDYLSTLIDGAEIVEFVETYRPTPVLEEVNS